MSTVIVRDAAAARAAGGTRPVRPRLDREEVAGTRPLLGEPAGEDAQAVAALLGFAAVGIEDAQAGVGVRRRHQGEDSVAADAAVAVAERTHGTGVSGEGEGRGVDDEVVVAEPMALAEDVRHAVERMP